MDDRCCNFSVLMANLVIGMCRGDEGLPSLLRDLDYDVQWIELEFANSQGKRVRPEAVTASERVRHTLLWEWKSGRSVPADQLRRYAGVTSQDLRERAFLGPSACENHDVTICAQGADSSRAIEGAVSAEGLRFPVLEVDNGGLSLVANEFAIGELSAGFRPKLEVDMDRVSRAYLPFDHESDDWVIAQECVTGVIELMSSREPRVLLEDLLARVFLAWGAVSAEYRRQLSLKSKRILIELARTEFHRYLRRSRARGRIGTPSWDILNNPLSLSTDKRTAVWKELLKLGQTFVEAVRTGTRQMALPLGEDGQ